MMRPVTRALAVELGPRGIRVNVVVPGYVRTPMLVFLLSQLSAYVDGQTCIVDGGWTAR